MFLHFIYIYIFFRFHVSFFWGVHLRDRIDFKMGIQILKDRFRYFGFLEHGEVLMYHYPPPQKCNVRSPENHERLQDDDFPRICLFDAWNK